MELSKQECWSGLPCPSPGDLPDPGIELVSLLHWQAGSLPLSHLCGRDQPKPRVSQSGHEKEQHSLTAADGHARGGSWTPAHLFATHVPSRPTHSKWKITETSWDLTSDISTYKVSVPELHLESFLSVRRKNQQQKLHSNLNNLYLEYK